VPKRRSADAPGYPILIRKNQPEEIFMHRTLKLIIASAFVLFSASAVMAADDVTGLWKGIDENTGETTMVTCIYEYQGNVFGRLVVTYEDGVLKNYMGGPDLDVADKWVGDPTYIGLDFIWEMEDRGDKWKKGNICDPEQGKVYSSEMWIEDGNLVVRGKIGPFGRNQVWLPVSESELPSGLDYGNPASWRPSVPTLKE
jgi:uncharacterized protein (DUF2147 family)